MDMLARKEKSRLRRFDPASIALQLFLMALATWGCSTGPAEGPVPPGTLAYRVVEIGGSAERDAGRYAVHFSPSWRSADVLNIVLFLHGMGYDERVWEKHAEVLLELDRRVVEGQLEPFVLVTPRGDRGMWRDWQDGSHQYATTVTRQVLPDIRRELAPVHNKTRLHIMGISMGGMGAAWLAMADPQAYASLTMISAPMPSPEEMLNFLGHPLVRALTPIDDIFGVAREESLRGLDFRALADTYALVADPRLIIAVGDDEIGPITRQNRSTHQYLRRRGVPHTYLEYAGGHDWKHWRSVVVDTLCLQLGGRNCGVHQQI